MLTDDQKLSVAIRAAGNEVMELLFALDFDPEVLRLSPPLMGGLSGSGRLSSQGRSEPLLTCSRKLEGGTAESRGEGVVPRNTRCREGKPSRVRVETQTRRGAPVRPVGDVAHGCGSGNRKRHHRPKSSKTRFATKSPDA